MSIKTVTTFLIAFAQSEAKGSVDAYYGRDGQAEALADIAQGKPARIYICSICGEFCRLEGVNILNCEPERFDTQTAPKTFFVSLPPEANGDSSLRQTPEQRVRGLSAYYFASSYNRTMFRQRKNEVLRRCPRATLEK